MVEEEAPHRYLSGDCEAYRARNYLNRFQWFLREYERSCHARKLHSSWETFCLKGFCPSGVDSGSEGNRCFDIGLNLSLPEIGAPRPTTIITGKNHNKKIWASVEVWATRRYIIVIFHIRPKIGPFPYIWSEKYSKTSFLGGNGNFGEFESRKILHFLKIFIFSTISVGFSSKNQWYARSHNVIAFLMKIQQKQLKK